MKILLSCFLALLLLPSLSWAETITISGSTTVKKFMTLAANAYQQKHHHIIIDLHGGGSSHGFGEAVNKRTDIGMMSRELTAEEHASMATSFKLITIAYDAVTPIISDELFHQQRITEMSMQQLAQIYRGKITNWQQVGGPNRPILVVDKEMHRGTRYVFAAALLGSPTAVARDDAVIIEDNQDVVNLVKASDQAIAYVSFSYADEQAHALPIRLENKQLVNPNAESIKQGNYPFSRKLHLIIPNDSPEYVQMFIAFLQSADGQALVKQAGYIPVSNN